MVVKTVLGVTNEHLFWYYSSSIGGLLSFIILFLLLIHIIYNYLKLFHVSIHTKLVEIRQNALSATNLTIDLDDEDDDDNHHDSPTAHPGLSDDPSNPLKSKHSKHTKHNDIDPNNHKLNKFTNSKHSKRNLTTPSPNRLTPASSNRTSPMPPKPRPVLKSKRSLTNTSPKPTNKIIYKLMIGYLISGILSSVIFAFVRSNVLWLGLESRIQDQDIYNSWYCGFGYFGGYIMRAFEKTFLYYLLLYRIQIVFKESAYNSLSQKLYKFLFVAWIPFVTIAVALVVLGM